MLKSKRFIHNVIVQSLFCCCLLAIPALSQLGPEELLNKAYEKANQGAQAEAVLLLEQISRDFPLTEFDAKSRRQRIVWLRNDASNQQLVHDMLEAMVQDFPNRSWSLSARYNILEQKFYAQEISAQNYLEGIDNIVSDAGGVTIFGSAKNIEFSPSTFFESKEDQKKSLGFLYGTVAAEILDFASEERLEFLSVAENNAKRVRLNLLNDGSDTATLSLLRGVLAAREGTPEVFPERDFESTKPVLTVFSLPIKPSDTAVLRMTDGNLEQSQIDLRSLEIRVDNEESGFEIDLTLSLGPSPEIFEDFEIKVIPEGTWQQGTHEIDIQVRDFDGNQASLNSTFSVGNVVSQNTLPSTKDSTLRAHKPHRNEGANPRLFLSHRLEARNKSQNPLVGFDLSEADLNGLSKATLVMNVQDCDLPRRWGKNGRFIEAHALAASWIEGNGNKYRVSGNNGKTKGEGQGVTWFSPADGQIRNNRPDGSQQWMGGRSITAPAVQVLNRQTGPIEFDVTQDVLQAASLGNSSPEISWLLKKQDESKFGNIRFYSKEGAAQAGDGTLAPTLILEYGDQTAHSSGAADWLAKLGFDTPVQLRLEPAPSELTSFRDQLKENPLAGFVGETLVSRTTGSNPMMGLAAQTAYRAWLT